MTGVIGNQVQVVIRDSLCLIELHRTVKLLIDYYLVSSCNGVYQLNSLFKVEWEGKLNNDLDMTQL
jgi:hypothetical protein